MKLTNQKISWYVGDCVISKGSELSGYSFHKSVEINFEI